MACCALSYISFDNEHGLRMVVAIFAPPRIVIIIPDSHLIPSHPIQSVHIGTMEYLEVVAYIVTMKPPDAVVGGGQGAIIQCPIMYLFILVNECHIRAHNNVDNS